MKISREFLNQTLILILLLILGMPGLMSPGAALFATILSCLLVRPRRRMWWPWIAVIPALLGNLVPLPPAPSQELLSRQLGSQCRYLLKKVERISSRPKIQGLLMGAGEAVDPAQPFQILDRAVAGEEGVTAYLADDRGQIVAWGGQSNAYPPGLRRIGPRHWDLRWTAMSATLVIREPLIVDGRIIGAITVTRRSGLEGRRLLGMSAPIGWVLRLGDSAPDTVVISPVDFPSIGVPVEIIEAGLSFRWLPRWLPWMILGMIYGLNAPLLGAVVVGTGLGLTMAGDPFPTVVLWMMILLICALLRRVIMASSQNIARAAVPAGIILLSVFHFFSAGADHWLPEHLVSIGPGLVYLLGAVWILSAWPVSSWNFGRRMIAALVLVLFALSLELGLALLMPIRSDSAGVSRLPEGDELSLDVLLPVSPDQCSIYDLATSLALEWNLSPGREGILLIVRDGQGQEVSRWGDLQAVGQRMNLGRSWQISGEKGRIELWKADDPWALLEDWKAMQLPCAGGGSPVWSAVLSRSGMPAASLHPEIGRMEPAEAARLYAEEKGRTWIEVEGRKMPAQVRRVGPWLVLQILHWPPGMTWVARFLVSLLWALAGITIWNPPEFSLKSLGTFGGKLRLLVGAAVILPLALLTIMLQFRLASQQREIDSGNAVESFRAARYAAENLAGETRIDDELARWLAAGWGGEISFFDGAELVAVSRPDLMDSGCMPELPETGLIPLFFLGREEPLVSYNKGQMIVGGIFQHQGRRLVLELTKPRASFIRGAASPVDWLLGVAGIAALLALAFARRIEDGLGRSLRDLVGVSRRLLHGEDLGKVVPPAEHDLAQVLAAVEGMARKVQERELRLRDQEEMLRITLSTLDPAVFLLDERGKILFINPSGEKLLKEESGDTIRSLFGKGEALPEGLMRPRPGHDESWRLGSARVPLPGKKMGTVLVIEDVGEMLRAQRLDQLNQMARIVAHEVKNPLTPIRLWVQELEEARIDGRDDLEALVDEACPALLKQIDRLRESANAFSNLVALEHWEARKVDLISSLNEILEDLDILQRRGIQIHRELQTDAAIDVDPQWFQRALNTLILNSVTAIGEGPGNIVFRSIVRDREVIVEIEDDGGGVAAENLDDLFSPRFSSTRTGTGLGLALVQQVMTRAQGEVHAENGESGLLIRMVFPR